MAYRLIGEQLLDNNGDPLNGGLVYVYEPGTTTARDSYPTADDADAATNPNANPVVLDSAGRGQIWGRDGVGYKLAIKTSADVTLDTIDDISSPNSQQEAIGYYVASGSANAQTVTASPAWASYVSGSVVSFKPVADNTGPCTLSVNGLPAKSIKMMDGSNVYAGGLDASGIHVVQYDGTNFVLLNPAEVAATYTGTLTGLTTTPTTSVKYVRSGNMVMIKIDGSETGTSNSNAFTITGAPTAIHPTTTSGVVATAVTDNGSVSEMYLRMTSAGVLQFLSAASASPFTASGTKGLTAGRSIQMSYMLT